MNRQINLYLILTIIIFSCSEDGTVIISNTPDAADLPTPNYKMNLHSNSGSFLEIVTIYWNGIDGEVELTDTNIPITSSWDPHTFSGMIPGEFKDIKIQIITSDSTYVDSIQIFTRPVHPVTNFRYEVNTVMRKNGEWDEGEDYVDLGNGEYDEGEDFTDLNDDGVWNEGEDYIDLGNGEYDKDIEEFDDTENQEKYHRVLYWTPTIEPDSTFSNYTIYRADYENVDILINPEYCGCEIATLTKSDTSFIDSMVTEKPGEFEYFYQIRVNSESGGRNSYLYNYTNFTAPSKVSLVDTNVSKNNSDFIQLTWDAISTSTYLYQYEIWRRSDDNADDLWRMAIIVDPNN